MAKKKKTKETTIEDFYDLKVDKMDELVAALKGEEFDETEDVSMNISDCTGVKDSTTTTKRGKERKFDPYSIDKLSRVPTTLKALFIKWWFAGVVCYFIMMGLGYYLMYDDLDMIIVLGIVMGIVVDVFVNPIFHFLESDRKEYDNFMLFPFPFKKFWTFFTNILYYMCVIIAVAYIFVFINGTLLNGKATLGVEPLLFGIFTVIVDMIVIGIKDLIVFLIRRAKKHTTENLNV
jgi:hypothetical protein